ncbi:MAG: glycosyltransferase [Lewinellaceae bacterium]|nr:glycosyltransferase [Saprospiraceae bacterium]MCB9341624.1 glycosyltransferase [Lewinellaceae bacterium]
MFNLDEFFGYWYSVGFWKITRVFWYFLTFEFVRYVGLEFFVLIVYRLNGKKRARRWEAARQALWNENPLISIIAPGKNEGKHIYKLVKSLNEQTYRNVEIIIVDDGSDDKTPIIGRSLEKAGLIDLFIRNDARGGKASGANVAMRYCKGKIVLHMDADCSFDHDAVENILVPFYMDEKIGGVGGNVKIREADTLCSKLQSIEYLKTISTGRIVTSYLGIYRIISGAFGAFRMDALRQVGGWDIGPGLDGDITVKLRKSGYRIHFEPSAVCLTTGPKKFSVLWKQRSRWSRSIVRFRLRKHRDVMLPHQNFNWSNYIGFVENIFYNIVLDFKWFVYFFDVAIHYSRFLEIILPFNLILYTITGYLQMWAIYMFSERKKQEMKLLPYVPFMIFYVALFLRSCQTLAYLRELLFKTSYKDPWNPQKSSYQAAKYGY